jgi:uncharacterized protein
VELTWSVAALVTLSGVIAGVLGSLLGVGGGVLLVPLLVLAFGMPMRFAVATSLMTVIATSSAVSAATAGRQLINLRLGMLLEVATAAGGLTGGITAQTIAPNMLARLFSVVTATVAIVTLARVNRRNILPVTQDPGPWGGRFFDEDTEQVVSYRLRRLPLALVGSFLAGQLSTLLGIGGGTLKVPLLNALCGIPLRVAAATSALMIGITATSGAIVYYGQGAILPGYAAAAVLGVSLGTFGGMRLGVRRSVRSLKLLMVILLFVVSVLMMLRTP